LAEDQQPGGLTEKVEDTGRSTSFHVAHLHPAGSRSLPRPAAPALEFTKGREHAIRSGMSARELIERQLDALRESFQREVYDFDGVDNY
jgi:hypothetical protein